MLEVAIRTVCFELAGTKDLPHPVRVPEVTQRREGSGKDVEVVVSALVALTKAAANALRKVGFKVLDLTAAINGACW